MVKPETALVNVSRALTAGVRKYGRAIVCNLAISLKTSRLYSGSHQNVTLAMDDLEDFVTSFVRLEGRCQISRDNDRLLLNEVVVKSDAGTHESFQYVLGLLAERHIGEIAFQTGVERKELETLVSLFTTAIPAGEDPWEWFAAALSRRALPHVAVTRYHQREDRAAPDTDAKGAAVSAYFHALRAMEAVLGAARDEKPMNFKRLKRAIQVIVDLTLDQEQLLLALVNLKDGGAAGSNHAVNVAILSVALGAKLELSKKLLSDLGFAAALHDLGVARLPEKLQAACVEDLSPEDVKLARSHVFSGVRLLLGEKMADSTVKSVNVAFLHHYRYDRTGYPKLLTEKEQNLYTRIVALSSHYDEATTPGRLTREPLSPDVVLRGIMDGSGTEFDPLVVKAFINLMGLYPPGCMVRLDTGEVGTVVGAPTNPRFLDRPSVKLLGGEGGNAAGTQVVDLLDRGTGGKFVRSIVKLYQQKEVEIELEEYLGVI